MPANTRLLRRVSIRGALLPIAVAAISAGTVVAAPAADAKPSQHHHAARVRMEPQQTLTATYKAPKVDGRITKVMRIMQAQQGDPYAYGSSGPNAFDCSGLVFYATHAAGFGGVPRTSGAQAGYMHRVARNAMKPGDFVFFSNGGRVYHVGMYMGGNRILHAPYPGARVRVENIWTGSWFGGTLR